MTRRPGASPGIPPPLRDVVATLGRHYGRQEPPPTRDPFELVLWENVAYLATPDRRREAFALLGREAGLAPARLLAASPEALERATGRGILKASAAEKLRACASLAIEKFGGDLRAVIRGPLDAAGRALRLFPSIGEPGADKILLFSGRAPLLAPESNGLRVLGRLGLVREDVSYARTYAAARALSADLPPRPADVQQAHLLLQVHGRTLCRRARPLCEACPLASVCAYAASSDRSGRKARAGKPARIAKKAPAGRVRR